MVAHHSMGNGSSGGTEVGARRGKEMTQEHPTEVIVRILAGVGRPIASTKLVKLVYLVDYTHYQHYGETLTGLKYDWDQFGPNAEAHAIVANTNELAKTGERVKGNSTPNVYGGQTNTFRFVSSEEWPQLSDVGEMIVDDIIAQYGHTSVREITRRSKKTAPFENAVQYSQLQMECHAPAQETKAGEWQSHLREIEEHGSISVDELMEEYELQ